MNLRNGTDPATNALLLEALEAQSTRLTELASVIRGLSLNAVLLDELVTIPAAGFIERNTSTPYASVGAWALDGDATVTSSPPAAGAPTQGIGVIPLPGGSAVVWPLAGTTVTVYGTAGERVLLTLWSKPQCPMVGIGGVSGGAP